MDAGGLQCPDRGGEVLDGEVLDDDLEPDPPAIRPGVDRMRRSS
jgi:hypothetical protein